MLVMLDFLNEIRATGKITRAAVRSQMSYRHCWNLIEKWAAFFGAPLVDAASRGAARGSPRSAKNWCGPDNGCRRGCGRSCKIWPRNWKPRSTRCCLSAPRLVRIHASHGFAVSKLRELLSREPQLGIDLRYVSNQNSLVSLARGALRIGRHTHSAGRVAQEGDRRCTANWSPPAEHRIIGFVTREMGLIVKRGNPLGITSLRSLFDSHGSLREPGSGIGHPPAFRSAARHSKARCNAHQRLRARRIHARRGRRLRGERHGRCEFRRRGRRPAVRSWTSCGSSRRTIFSFAASKSWRIIPSKRLFEIMRSDEFGIRHRAPPG